MEDLENGEDIHCGPTEVREQASQGSVVDWCAVKCGVEHPIVLSIMYLLIFITGWISTMSTSSARPQKSVPIYPWGFFQEKRGARKLMSLTPLNQN